LWPLRSIAYRDKKVVGILCAAFSLLPLHREMTIQAELKSR
jgi:hypothetical protein